MDEPLSNLDAKLRVQTCAEIKKPQARLEVTTIYVTHHQTEAMTIGSRIAVMCDGLVQQVDSPLNLYEKLANLFAAGFIGSPAMNFIEAGLAQKNGISVLDAGFFAMKVPADVAPYAKEWMGKKVIFGIRPEDIQDKAFARDANSAWTLLAMVDVHEPLGSDVIVHLSSGSLSIVARVDAHSQAKMGQQADVVFNMRKMHLFDQQTHTVII